MSKIQNRVNSLQPYVIQFRFQNGITIVDTVFKNGWHVPKSKIIENQKGDSDEINYHMFFSQEKNIGLDEILDHIEKIINLNIEREKKHELLKIKAKELQEIFRKNPLSKLQNMRFVLGGENLINDMEPDPMDVVDISLGDENEEVTPEPEPEQVSPEPEPEQPEPEQENVRRAPNGEIIPPLSPEDSGEIDEEFKRVDLTGTEEPITKRVHGQKIDLPPKKKDPKVKLEEFEEPSNVVCKCGPEEVCPACEEEKIGSY